MPKLYISGIGEVGQALTDLDGSDIRAMLVQSSYVFDKLHTRVDDGTGDDPKSHELTVAGYGRKALANKVFSVEVIEGEDAYVLDADNLAFGVLPTGEAIGGVVIFRHTGDDTTAPLLGWYGEPEPIPTNGAPIGVTWPAPEDGGVIYIDSPETS